MFQLAGHRIGPDSQESTEQMAAASPHSSPTAFKARLASLIVAPVVITSSTMINVDGGCRYALAARNRPATLTTRSAADKLFWDRPPRRKASNGCKANLSGSPAHADSQICNQGSRPRRRLARGLAGIGTRQTGPVAGAIESTAILSQAARSGSSDRIPRSLCANTNDRGAPA